MSEYIGFEVEQIRRRFEPKCRGFARNAIEEMRRNEIKPPFQDLRQRAVPGFDLSSTAYNTNRFETVVDSERNFERWLAPQSVIPRVTGQTAVVTAEGWIKL